MVGTKISGLTGGPSYCQPGGAGHASLSSTPLVPRGASASRGEDTALAAHHTNSYAVAQRGAQRAVQDIVPYLRMLVVGDIRARSYATGQQSLDDETTLMYRRVWYYKIDSHGHKSLVKRQHSTRRRCIGLEGAVNTTASSVPLKHEPRVEGGAAAKRRGRAGSVRSAAGGVRPPPLAAGKALDVQGGYRAMCGRSCRVTRMVTREVC